jgi:hypothetical protein
MLERLFAALLLGGLFLGLTPTAAVAYDGHYRCMYHCQERGYGRDGYGRDGYGRDGYDRYGYDRYRQDRVYHNGECWYHDDWGWRRCGYRYYGYDYGHDEGYSEGRPDSHRHHPRNG